MPFDGSMEVAGWPIVARAGPYITVQPNPNTNVIHFLNAHLHVLSSTVLIKSCQWPITITTTTIAMATTTTTTTETVTTNTSDTNNKYRLLMHGIEVIFELK